MKKEVEITKEPRKILIVRCNKALLNEESLEQMREKIKGQINEGVVMLPGYYEYSVEEIDGFVLRGKQ